MIPITVEDDAPASAAPVSWRRLLALVLPLWRGLAAMASLSVAGSLVGLVPPLGLGFLVNDLAAGQSHSHAALWAAVIAVAVLVEGTAYALSDGFYARTAGRLYRALRILMLDGALRQTASDGETASGLATRFVSDAETVEHMTVALLDAGAMRLVELCAALVAVGALDAWSVAIAVALILAGAAVARMSQSPVAAAGHERQDALEGMSRTLARALAERSDPDGARRRFHTATSRLLAAETRLGWLQAANRHGSAALAALGPIAVVVAAAFRGQLPRRHTAFALPAGRARIPGRRRAR